MRPVVAVVSRTDVCVEDTFFPKCAVVLKLSQVYRRISVTLKVRAERVQSNYERDAYAVV